MTGNLRTVPRVALDIVLNLVVLEQNRWGDQESELIDGQKENFTRFVQKHAVLRGRLQVL